MQGTVDTHNTGTAGDGGPLGPREAARLLEETKREAKRQLSFSPPLIMAAMAILILVAYGALWLSTRGQHPYKGPSLGVVGLVYAAVAVSIAMSVKVLRPYWESRAAKPTGGSSAQHSPS